MVWPLHLTYAEHVIYELCSYIYAGDPSCMNWWRKPNHVTIIICIYRRLPVTCHFDPWPRKEDEIWQWPRTPRLSLLPIQLQLPPLLACWLCGEGQRLEITPSLSGKGNGRTRTGHNALLSVTDLARRVKLELGYRRPGCVYRTQLPSWRRAFPNRLSLTSFRRRKEMSGYDSSLSGFPFWTGFGATSPSK